MCKNQFNQAKSSEYEWRNFHQNWWYAVNHWLIPIYEVYAFAQGITDEDIYCMNYVPTINNLGKSNRIVGRMFVFLLLPKKWYKQKVYNILLSVQYTNNRTKIFLSLFTNNKNGKITQQPNWNSRVEKRRRRMKRKKTNETRNYTLTSQTCSRKVCVVWSLRARAHDANALHCEWASSRQNNNNKQTNHKEIEMEMETESNAIKQVKYHFYILKRNKRCFAMSMCFWVGNMLFNVPS